MLKLSKILTKEFLKSDIYQCSFSRNQLICNDKSKGIQLFDLSLNLQKKITILPKITIEKIFITFTPVPNAVFLYSYENNCQIYVDLETGSYKSIKNNYELSPLYHWDKNNLLVVTQMGWVLTYDHTLNEYRFFKNNFSSNKLSTFLDLIISYFRLKPFAVDSQRKHLFFTNDIETIIFFDVDLIKEMVYAKLPNGIAIGGMMFEKTPLIVTEDNIYGWDNNQWHSLLDLTNKPLTGWQQLSNSTFLLITYSWENPTDKIFEIYEIA